MMDFVTISHNAGTIHVSAQVASCDPKIYNNKHQIWLYFGQNQWSTGWHLPASDIRQLADLLIKAAAEAESADDASEQTATEPEDGYAVDAAGTFLG